jgi:hypothetical protein
MRLVNDFILFNDSPETGTIMFGISYEEAMTEITKNPGTAHIMFPTGKGKVVVMPTSVFSRRGYNGHS